MSELRLRPAGWLDTWHLWRWRNHPSTRSQMFDGRPFGFLSHLQWFLAYRRGAQDPARRGHVYMAVDGRHAIGYGHVLLGERPGTSAVLSVVVAPRYRGQGYGRPLIELLAAEAAARGGTPIVADVFRWNFPSLRAFRRAGFRPAAVQPAPRHGREIVRLVR